MENRLCVTIIKHCQLCAQDCESELSQSLLYQNVKYNVSRKITTLDISFLSLQRGYIFTRKARNFHYLVTWRFQWKLSVAATGARELLQDCQLKAEISLIVWDGLWVCLFSRVFLFILIFREYFEQKITLQISKIWRQLTAKPKKKKKKKSVFLAFVSLQRILWQFINTVG